jgi:hypothetical protein
MSFIKAIETKYNGYHFRSRLEARWAVFFDALGVKYEYEPEGYDLTETYNSFNDGKEIPKDHQLTPKELWYLPDFYLPDYKCFIEIKPQDTLTDAAADRCYLLEMSTGRPVLILIGWPGVDSYEVYCLQTHNTDGIGPFVFAQGRQCDRLWLAWEEQAAALNCENCWSPRCGELLPQPHFAMHLAYDAARSARF